MRRILLLAAATVIGACGVFGSEEPRSVASPDGEDGGDGAVDGVGKPPPPDDGFNIDAAPSATPVVQGVSTKVKVTVTRGKDFKGVVDLKTRDLRDGITSAPLAITGDSGELEIAVPAATPQGAADGVIEGTSGASKATTALKTFVRGKPGDLDTTYGVGGIAGDLYGAGSKAVIVDAVLAPDDSVYVVAWCLGSLYQSCVTHVGRDGKVDPAYGTNGVAKIVGFVPRGAALQPDGRLLVVGGNSAATAAAARLAASGAPDSTFGDGAFGLGTVKLPTGSLLGGENRGATAVAVRRDGDIFLTCDRYDLSVNAMRNVVMKMDPQGNLRTGFGASGTTISALGLASALTVRNNPASASKGSLVWMGAGVGNTPNFIGIMQVDGDSSADGNYFGGQFKTAPVPGARRDGGTGYNADGAGLIELADESIITAIDGTGGVYLRKFTPMGDGAPGFGTSGLAGPFVTNGVATGIAGQVDGKFLISIQRDGGLEAIRFAADGKIDDTFGQAGRVTKVQGAGGSGRKVVVQKSGRILLSIVHDFPDYYHHALVAYWP